jgi:hypothetical protein
MQQDQYHHYIPRFLLRNFAINYYESIFVSNKKLFKEKKHKQNFMKKNKEEALLQIYDRKTGQLDTSLVAKTYGYTNMYKDLDHENVMHVEEKFGKLEGRAAKTVKDIISTSREKSEIVLSRKDLEDLRKFLFIMNYRNRSRLAQFTEKKFDIATWTLMENFMKEHNLKIAQEVWLQNIREILETPHMEIENNSRIFWVDRTDYKLRMFDCFLVIWQAGENDEFLITKNGFGIFEGVDAKPLFQFAYHWFYVISPKLVLVLCEQSFRKEIGFNTEFHAGFRPSIFKNVPHPPAIPKYVSVETPKYVPPNEYGRSTDKNPFTAFDSYFNSIGLERREDDTFTFPFVKVTSDTVHLVNTVFLNEAQPDLILTFLSHSYLYKTIIKYYKHHKKLVPTGMFKKDFSDLKRELFKVLNKTHEEDLNLRKKISSRYTRNWNVCVMDSKS